MMPLMTERGLPIVDGAPACPFVAFDDDREARGTSPDHRHRCYAEVRPAPRALAHQEAYCLTSAFPVCPAFQDWARREAAAARPAPGGGSSESGPGAASEPAAGAGGQMAGMLFPSEGPKRNPPRDWTSPPPWLGSSDQGAQDDGDEDREVLPIPSRGGGLAGSFADRIVGGSADVQPSDRPASRFEAPAPGEPAVAERRPAAAPGEPAVAPRGRPSGRSVPSWERLPRGDAYPTLKTRMGLNGISVPPILMWIAALVLAAVAMFTLPGLLGIGNPPQAPTGPSQSTNPRDPAASATPVEPTLVPVPTAQIYIVQANDTMSRIANRFGVPLQVLIDANAATVPNPDRLSIGQEVIIPAVAPTTLPDAGTTTTP